MKHQLGSLGLQQVALLGGQVSQKTKPTAINRKERRTNNLFADGQSGDPAGQHGSTSISSSSVVRHPGERSSYAVNFDAMLADATPVDDDGDAFALNNSSIIPPARTKARNVRPT